MTETEFLRYITRYLDELYERLEAEFEDIVECELAEGILKINLESGGVYIINRNLPRRELWMSSPYSGGSHYSLVNDKWINIRSSENFEQIFWAEIKQHDR